MSTTLINSSIILNEILRQMETQMVAVKFVDRQYDKQFAKSGTTGKPGTALKVRKPVDVALRSGRVMQTQDIEQEYVEITCTEQIGVDLPAFTSEQLTMSLDDLSENGLIKSSSSRLAAEMDRLILATYPSFYHSAGTTTDYAVFDDFGEAAQKLDEINCPKDEERSSIICPVTQRKLVNELKALANPSSDISDQYRNGTIGRMSGLKFSMDQNIASHTTGTRVGTTLVDDAGGTTLVEGMTTLHVDGFTNATDTVTKGDVFTIAGVYAVNPLTKVAYGHLQQFVCTELATAASNEVDIKFFPAIHSTGVKQNVTALPINDAAVTFKGAASKTCPQDMVLHKDAITLVTADLILPKGVHDAARKNYKGISIRMITDYNQTNDTYATRFDIFKGITVMRPELGVRVWGKLV